MSNRRMVCKWRNLWVQNEAAVAYFNVTSYCLLEQIRKIYINFSTGILPTFFGTTNVVDTNRPCTARLGNCVLAGTCMCTYLDQPTGSVQVLSLNKHHTMTVYSF